MDKCSALVVSLLSLFLLFSFRGYAIPQYDASTNTSFPDNNSQYNPSSVYYFNITWTNTTVDEPLTNVNFTLVRPDNSVSVFNLSSGVLNNSSTLPAETSIYFTQDQLGPAGLYKFNWTASNGTYVNNTFPTTVYYVSNASSPIRLFLDGNESNKTYNLNYQNANFTAYFLGKNITLTSNMIGFVTQNISEIINLNKTGLFYLNASFGGDQNYSSNFTTYYFNVTPWSASVTYPNSSVTYSPGQNYQFNVTWQNTTPINNVYFVFNGANVTPTGNRTINANNTEFYLNEADLSANPTGYTYNFNVNDTNGNTISSNQWNYVINQVPVTLAWSLPDTSGSWSAITGTTATITCQSNLNLNLTLVVGTSTSYSSTLGIVSTTASSSTLASFSFFCQPADYANYSGSISGILTFSSSSTTSSSGSSSSGSSSPGSFIINGLTPTLSINPGESRQVSFTLKNTLGEGAIANVTISVKGIDSSWYTPLSTIKYSYNNIPQTLTLTFKIPSDAEAKDYTVNIAAIGKFVINSSAVSTPSATMKLTVASPQPIQPLPNVTVSPQETTSQDNNTANITSNQTSLATGLVPAFDFFRNNLVIILAIAACLLIFIFRDDITTALGGTIVEEKPEKTHKAKSASKLKGIKDKLNYKLVVNLKKEGKAKSLKETEVQGEVPEAIPEKEPKRPAVLEKEIKRDIKELQNIIESEKKVKNNKKKFDMNNN